MLSKPELPTVSLANREDESQLMELCRLLHGENGLASMDDGNVRSMLNRAFDRQGGTIGVIRGPERIEAAIYMLMTTFWYTRETHLEELFNVVHPEHRHGHHAEALIKFALKCSADLSNYAGFHIPLVIGIMTNTRMAGKVRLYRRLLGYPAGAMFVANARWPNEPAGEDFWRAPFPEHAFNKNTPSRQRRNRERLKAFKAKKANGAEAEVK